MLMSVAVIRPHWPAQLVIYFERLSEAIQYIGIIEYRWKREQSDDW